MAKAYVSLALVLCFALPPTVLAAETTRLIWSELSAAQRQVLAPLEAEWPRFALDQRRRWIALADRYPKLSPAEQKRMQERMQEWAKLSPQQRDAARARYRALSKLSPEQRREIIRQWTESQEAQQALPAETTPTPTPTEATETAKPTDPGGGTTSDKTAESATTPTAETEKPPAQ